MIVAGIDEVGRGPLAGPVCAACVVLGTDIEGLKDSKKLTKRKRESLAIEIHKQALAVTIGWATVAEIDKLNILQATMLAMTRAYQALPIKADLVKIDGNKVPSGIRCRAEAIVGGDGCESNISAASIVAKVARDRVMAVWDRYYPGYGFVKNSGYGTPQHLAMLTKQGATALHRRSFAPVAAVLERGLVAMQWEYLAEEERGE